MNIRKKGGTMHRILWLATITVLAAGAQVVEKKALTLEGAKKVIAAAEAEAVKNRVGCNVAVVDDGGNLIAFHRIDPTFPAGARVSIGKARMAALFRQPTKNFEDVITQKGRTSMIALDDFTPLQRGVPIIVGGQIVGAVGVSGASSADQDEQFAKAGAAALK
jgi:glc operon protein GlcG